MGLLAGGRVNRRLLEDKHLCLVLIVLVGELVGKWAVYMGQIMQIMSFGNINMSGLKG